MYPKLPFLAAVSVYLLSLNACPPGNTDESRADFWVGAQGSHGASGYVPNGYGWKPNSKLEISIFNEPDGPDSQSAQWKKILDVNVDSNGMFGFGSNPPFYPVKRNFCGDAQGGHQTDVWMVKSLTTGWFTMRQVPVDLYFTFQPCH